MKPVINNMLADQDPEFTSTSPSRLEYSPITKSENIQTDSIFNIPQFIPREIGFRSISFGLYRQVKLPDPFREKDDFSKLKQRISDIFENQLKIKPITITLQTNPEDMEEDIVVTVPLGNTEDPLEALLSIKRKLRKIDKNLARKVVILPSD